MENGGWREGGNGRWSQGWKNPEDETSAEYSAHPFNVCHWWVWQKKSIMKHSTDTKFQGWFHEHYLLRRSHKTMKFDEQFPLLFYKLAFLMPKHIFPEYVRTKWRNAILNFFFPLMSGASLPTNQPAPITFSDLGLASKFQSPANASGSAQNNWLLWLLSICIWFSIYTVV